MKELALVDGDIVAYRCSCTSDEEGIVLARVDEMMQRILHETNAIEYKAFLTGSNNFRKEIYPEYKANRDKTPRPEHLQACRQHLVLNWKAKISDGNEADDELGIEQTAQGLDSVLCSIDKDLLQIPGYHYNFVRCEERFVSPYDGLRSFYKQVITGDGADNIPAFDGKFRSATPQFVQKLLDPLDEMTDEWDMYSYATSIWCQNDCQVDLMHRNAKCLWVQRFEGQQWQPPSPQSQ